MVLLELHFHVPVIILSTGVAFLGTFTSLSLCEQYRLSTLGQSTTNKVFLLTLVAVSLGTVGMWATHYIAMGSFSLELDEKSIPVRYNYLCLFSSLALVNLMALGGLYCASTDHCFNKSKNEILELFVSHASNQYSLTKIKQMGKMRLLWTVLTHSPQRIIMGGALAGGGVGLMHYVGMMSMEFQGTVTLDPCLVFFSVVIVIVSGICAFWLFFRVLSVFPSLDILRIICATIGMFSLSGVHYVGLSAAVFHFDPRKLPPDVNCTIDAYGLLVGVVIASVVFCEIMHVYVLSDLRGWLLKTSTQLRLADAAITQAHSTRSHGSNTGLMTATNSSVDLHRYMMRYSRDGSGMSSSAMGLGGTATLAGANNPPPSLALFNDYDEGEHDDAATILPYAMGTKPSPLPSTAIARTSTVAIKRGTSPRGLFNMSSAVCPQAIPEGPDRPEDHIELESGVGVVSKFSS